MPGTATASSVSIYIQDEVRQEGGVFRMLLLRPTGIDDQYDVVYDSDEITVSGFTTGQIATFPFPNGSVLVQAGDVFAHYGRGIPFSGGIPDALPIYYPVVAPPVVETQIQLGADSQADYPYREDLSRDYAWAIPLIGGGPTEPADLRIEVSSSDVTLRWTADTSRRYTIDGGPELTGFPQNYEDSLIPMTEDAMIVFPRPAGSRFFFRVQDIGSAE